MSNLKLAMKSNPRIQSSLISAFKNFHWKILSPKVTWTSSLREAGKGESALIPFRVNAPKNFKVGKKLSTNRDPTTETWAAVSRTACKETPLIVIGINRLPAALNDTLLQFKFTFPSPVTPVLTLPCVVPIAEADCKTSPDTSSPVPSELATP